ncbi:MAG: peptidoglycan DD-metalloendopeptidase family protein [Nitrospirota bacterium]
MKKAFTAACIILIAVWVMRVNFSVIETGEQPAPEQGAYKEVVGTIGRGETFFDIFKKWKLDMVDLFALREASAGIHRLREVRPGQPYKIVLDDNGLRSFDYWIDDDSILSINREEGGFCAARKTIDYEKRLQHLGGVIADNLVASMGQGRDNLMLALQLSDIFAWDIDFTSDLRNGDTFKIVVEGLYLDGEFRKYGNILSAEFSNDGESCRAYRFEHNGKIDYYDDEGKSLRRAFLKAPLSFRRISSGFSLGRSHPVLKIYRPHHGLDYAAPAGTPVSAIGDGAVVFAGKKGQYGNLVIIRHPNGYKTYYGHLSRFGSGIKSRIKVKQGQAIGYVGSTGLATGPHLHYEIRVNNRPVNPVAVKTLKGSAIPKKLMAEFRGFKKQMYGRLASIMPTTMVFAKK